MGLLMTTDICCLSHLCYTVHTCDDSITFAQTKCTVITAWTVRLPEILRKNGMLVVASSGTWDEEALAPLLADT